MRFYEAGRAGLPSPAAEVDELAGVHRGPGAAGASGAVLFDRLVSEGRLAGR